MQEVAVAVTHIPEVQADYSPFILFGGHTWLPIFSTASTDEPSGSLHVSLLVHSNM
jgi:hypothetical protein